VKPEDRAAAPLIEAEVALLDEVVVPRFRTLDRDSARAQHAFRLGHIVVILGGAAATALGAVQAALGGGEVGIGIAEAVLGSVLSGTLVYVRGRRFQQAYLMKRLTAERVKSQYFLFLARAGPYTLDDPGERLRLLRRTLDRIESGDEAR
jgi:hypothetical protein